MGDFDYENMNNFNDSDDEEETGDKKPESNLDDLDKEEEIEKA